MYVEGAEPGRTNAQVGAGLFVRTSSSLANVHLGFDHERVLLVNVSAQRTELAPGDRLATFERVRESVRALPGVAEAALCHGGARGWVRERRFRQPRPPLMSAIVKSFRTV